MTCCDFTTELLGDTPEVIKINQGLPIKELLLEV